MTTPQSVRQLHPGRRASQLGFSWGVCRSSVQAHRDVIPHSPAVWGACHARTIPRICFGVCGACTLRVLERAKRRESRRQRSCSLDSSGLSAYDGGLRFDRWEKSARMQGDREGASIVGRDGCPRVAPTRVCDEEDQNESTTVNLSSFVPPDVAGCL